MRFGPRATREAEGTLLAHGYRLPSGTLAKGRRLDADDVDRLLSAGVAEVVVAEPGPEDVLEDEAARRVAAAAAGTGLGVKAPFTGRCNLVARSDGVVVVDVERVHGANRVDEALTLATVSPFTPVRRGDLVATAKTIPLAVDGALVARCVAALEGSTPAVRLAPFRRVRAGLVLTTLPGTRAYLLSRSEAVLRARLEAAGSELASVRVAPHREDEVAEAVRSGLDEGLELLLVLGASAVVDRADVVPRGVERAGAVVERLGMPVDPGNLLLLARRGGATVLGVPGCARSPKRSGFDQALERLLAGLPLDAPGIGAMGVGGLLAEIPSRPQPREASRRGREAPGLTVGAVLLAAGSSRRMGAANKLLEELDGTPLVARVADVLLATRLHPVVVVTGHDGAAVCAALGDRPLRLVHNGSHAQGMSTSLRAGVEALGEGVDGVLVALGDMPRVGSDDIEALLDAFEAAGGGVLCVPVHARKRGNPVLLPASLLPEVERLTGDVGARDLLVRHADLVREVPISRPGILLDVDTREALDELRSRGAATGSPDGPPTHPRR